VLLGAYFKIVCAQPTEKLPLIRGGLLHYALTR